MFEFSGTPNLEKLQRYGFQQDGEKYLYCTQLLNGQFRLTVTVSREGVQTTLFDCDFQEEYTLHLVAEANGEFVNRVREELNAILQDIETNCFENTKSALVQAIFDFAREAYGDEPEYLWEDCDYAVLRRKDTKKWYAIVMDIPQKRLGLEGDHVVEILDVRIDSENLSQTIDGKRFFPAYHMNKKHWITILLNGSLPKEEIFQYLNDSYQMAKK